MAEAIEMAAEVPPATMKRSQSESNFEAVKGLTITFKVR